MADDLTTTVAAWRAAHNAAEGADEVLRRALRIPDGVRTPYSVTDLRGRAWGLVHGLHVALPPIADSGSIYGRDRDWIAGDATVVEYQGAALLLTTAMRDDAATLAAVDVWCDARRRGP